MADYPVYLTKEDVLKQAKTANGLCVKDFNVNKRLITLKNKGVIGQIVEEGIFGYPINNRAEPDFAKLGIELKVTGVKELKSHEIVAKERLVLNIIDYFSEAKSDFEHSSFWLKNQKLLLMFYKYQDSVSPEEYRMIDSILYTYPLEDLKIIKDDWISINNKINDGKAHLISEADTMYLAACTKGANGEAVRLQPYSDIAAKQRAFCLKSSYINRIIKQNYIKEKCENIFSFKEIENETFEFVFYHRLKKYIGLTASELKNKFDIQCNSKNIFELIAAKMLGLSGKINKTEEFQKANIVLKTIRMEEDGKIIESMSFPFFRYKELLKEEWETSALREMFLETKFMFVVFKKKNGEYSYEKSVFWNMPLDILETKVKEVWQKTYDCISSGEIVNSVKYDKNNKKCISNNFPGMSFNGICHVRPHARDAGDTFELPVPDKKTGVKEYTKMCFWLNNSFIKKIVDKSKE